MARIPRPYRVRSYHSDGTVEQRHYQGPEAAEERRQRFEQADPFAVISVTPSHPVTYPRPAGAPTPMDIPDSLVERRVLNEFLLTLGIKPEAVQLVMVSELEVVVEYQPDLTGKRAPKLWRVSIIEP